jgi:hypothetical protein
MGGYNFLEPTGRANARPMTGSVALIRVKKTRQNKTLEPRSDSIGTEKALAGRLGKKRKARQVGCVPVTEKAV